MRHVWPTLALLPVLLSASAAGDGVDRDRLRRAIRLPTFRMNFTFGVTNKRGFVSMRREVSMADARSILDGMQGDPTDAERLERLAGVYDELGRKELARRAWNDAAKLLGERLDADPRDAALWARLGTARYRAGDREGAEVALRKGVELEPKGWEVWLALARFLARIPMSELLDAGARLEYETDGHGGAVGFARVLEILRETEPSQERISRSYALFREASRAHDRAVELAPEESSVHLARGLFRAFDEVYVRALYRALGGATVQPNAEIMPPSCLPDFRTAVHLAPDDLETLCIALFAELQSFSLRYRGPAPEEGGFLSVMPSRSRQFIEPSLERLEKFTRVENAHEAVVALEFLAFLEIMLRGRNDRAEALARRVLELAPGRKRAALLIAGLLQADDRHAELAVFCEEALVREDDTEIRYILAKAHESLGRYDRVREDLEAALRLSPDDFLAQLGMGALLLRASDDAGDRGFALRHIERAARVKGEPSDRERWKDLHTLLAIHRALEGEVDEAQRRLREVLAVDPADEQVLEALEAIGRPVDSGRRL